MPHLNPPRRIQGVMTRMPMGPAKIAVPIGVVLTLAGVGMACAWYFEVVGVNREFPGWILAWVGGLFATCGTYLAAVAMRHVRWKRHARSLAFAWQRDHPWPPRETLDDSSPGMRQHAAAVAVAVGILVPLNLGLMLSLEPGFASLEVFAMIPLLGLLLLDLLIFLSLAFLAYRVVQQRRFGQSRLTLESGPPILLGGELRARLSASPQLASAATCTATLRAVHEFMVSQGEDSTHCADVLYEETAPLVVSPSGEAQIRFAVPADGIVTSLAEPPTRYWELVISAQFTGVDFEAVFLLPVYATAD